MGGVGNTPSLIFFLFQDKEIVFFFSFYLWNCYYKQKKGGKNKCNSLARWSESDSIFLRCEMHLYASNLQLVKTVYVQVMPKKVISYEEQILQLSLDHETNFNRTISKVRCTIASTDHCEWCCTWELCLHQTTYICGVQ